eukprot:6172080-Pleurochrysis_carterae.AAC.1
MRSPLAWTSASTHSGRGLMGVEFPPFKVNINSAVEFLRAVLDSAVGTRISHFSLPHRGCSCASWAAFLSAKDACTKHAVASHTCLQQFRPFMRLFLHQFISSSACQRLAHTH